MDLEERYDRDKFTDVEWLHVRLRDATDEESLRRLRDDAVALQKDADDEALQSLLGLQAMLCRELGEYEEVAELHMRRIRTGDEKHRSSAVWVMASDVNELAGRVDDELLLEVLDYSVKPRDGGEYLSRLIEALGVEEVREHPRALEIARRFCDEFGFDEPSSLEKFVEVATVFFEDRDRWNRAMNRGRTPDLEEFHTEYWREYESNRDWEPPVD